MTDRLLVYYDDLRRLAESKCASREEAEDLVSETFLAAYAYIRRGGVIEYPKTYLANTLMHKRNSLLRKAYRRPPVVSLDTLEAVPEDIVDESSDEDAAELRRRILYLSETTREVLIRHYFNGYSIADIAKQIGIPAGTVKSRLSAGREKIKEGWMKPMPEKKTCIPGFLNVSYSGSDGANHEPTSLVEGDRIAQNLLITAYDRPLSVAELAAAVSIPTVYVEPIVRRLVDGELMAATGGGKVYTDFVIYKPEDFLSRFDAQLAFVHERFNRFWSVLADVLAEIGASDFGGTLSVRPKRKLERYALLRALQGFQLGFFELPSAPARRDGGSWIAMGRAFPGGYDDSAYCSANEYAVQGGHRTSGGCVGEVRLQLCEFDTTLWDNPARWAGSCGFDVYFREMPAFLWCVYRGVPVEKARISSTMLESIDRLIDRTGLLAREDGVLCVDIPVLSRADYTALERIIVRGRDRLKAGLGTEYRAFLKGQQIGLPGHLRSVPPYCRFLPATEYLVMAVLREAYEKRLHLADVDYCCPPVVLVCDEI